MEAKVIKHKTGVVVDDKLSNCCTFPIGEMTVTYTNGTIKKHNECTYCHKVNPAHSLILERS